MPSFRHISMCCLASSLPAALTLILKLLQTLTLTHAAGLRAGCYLGLSPVLQEMLEKQPALADAPPGATFFMAGCAAGLTSALLTQPMDTVKTRLQAFLNVEARAQLARWSASCSSEVLACLK